VRFVVQRIVAWDGDDDRASRLRGSIKIVQRLLELEDVFQHVETQDDVELLSERHVGHIDDRMAIRRDDV
jgi:hypothetical protein